jgi:nicotinamidase-related amidase
MANEALLIMDVQNGIIERFADQAEPLLATLSQALIAAREADRTVIFVRVAFREGAPEASTRNKSFAALASSFRMDESAHATQIHDRLEPASCS